MYKHARVVWCKKPLERTKYSRNETILKIGHLAKAKAMQRLEALQNGNKTFEQATGTMILLVYVGSMVI